MNLYKDVKYKKSILKKSKIYDVDSTIAKKSLIILQRNIAIKL